MATKTSLPQSFTPADLTGRRTLVTGGGRGIGAIARRLIAGGARVAIADVDEDGARTAAEELGNGTIALRCDVRSTADVEAAVAAAVAELGGLDGLVNNAGIEIAKPITELSEDEFTNLRRPWRQGHPVRPVGGRRRLHRRRLQPLVAGELTTGGMFSR